MYNKRSGFSITELTIVLIIVSILLIGALEGKKMIGISKLNAVRTLTLTSPVVDMNGLALWLESTMSESFEAGEALDGTLINKWNDVNPGGGIKYEFTSSGSNRPTYINRAINNLPAIEFTSGAGNYMQSTPEGLVSGIANQGTWFFVLKSHSTGNQIWFTDSSDRDSNGYHMGYNTSDKIFYQSNDGPSINSIQTATAISDFNNKPYIISFVADRNQALSLYLNSKKSTASATLSNSTIIEHAGKIYLGDITPSDDPFSGYIGEVIVFSRDLTDLERRDVENYLSAKWKIELDD